ncbi:MAG: AMP-binding protein [Chitinivibrionales bacterium]|nr:AMP-binding protein [Chitinivibrionales bacterium]
MRRTVIDLLSNAASAYHHKPYLNDKTNAGYRGKTFHGAYTEARFCALSLLREGIGHNDKIAILSESRSQWVIAEYASLMAGAIVVPLSVRLLPEEILFRLKHSDSHGAFVSRNTLGLILPILKKIGTSKFLIVYLDADFEIAQNLCHEAAGSSQVHLVSYQTLVDDGLQLHSQKQNKQRLDTIIESIKESDVVTISYTSGTTGNPKGIMLTNLNYWSNSVNAISFFALPEFYRLMVILPIDHSFAHTVGLFAACIRGLSLFFVDSRGGSKNALKNIIINISEANPDFMLTVPALSKNFMNKIVDGVRSKGFVIQTLFSYGLKCAEHAPVKNGGISALFRRSALSVIDRVIFHKIRMTFGKNLKFFIGGGAFLDISQQKFFKAIGIPIYQGYGLTEAAPIISTNKPTLHKFGTSGQVIPSLECLIVNDSGGTVCKGEKGEIIVRGESIMKGYYKNHAATNDALRHGWLHTGDLGSIDDDGFLSVIGREKALLISSDGEKYSPEEIEEAIVNSSRLIAQVMIYNDHKKFTVALITLDRQRVIDHIKAKNITTCASLLDEIKKSFYQFKTTSEYGKKFPDKWIPSTFRIIKEPFSEQNNMINSTLKMVRHKIVETYQHILDSIYGSEGTEIVVQNNITSVEHFLPAPVSRIDEP